MTICRKCKHCKVEDPGLSGEDFFCMAPEVRLVEAIDCVTGRRGWADQKEENRGYSVEYVPYPYCHVINRGVCPHYVARG